jgi:hypothetical protein
MLLKFFRRVSNLSKHQMGPTEILTFLGIEFDTLAMELQLPNEKLVELKHTLELFVQSKKVLFWPPTLSVNNSRISFEAHALSVITVTPLYSDKKVNQTLISSRIDFDTRILWWGFLILHVASISLLQNALPGDTTWHAKLSNPIKDCNCRKVTFLDWTNKSRVCFNSTSFPLGNRSSIANVSNSMLRNVKISVGSSFIFDYRNPP